jgi:Mn-dependent DtxR family transcriptional regulator
MAKKNINIREKIELKIFPDIESILSFIETEKYSTISAISRQFKIHPMTASDIVKRMKSQGLISIEQIGSAKIVKRVT